MTVYSKPLFCIGAILIFSGTYLDYSHRSSTVIVDILLIPGILLALLALKKPKNFDDSTAE